MPLLGQKMHTLLRKTVIPAPIDRVFDFFSEAANLNQITPPWLHFKILTKDSIRMEKGTHIDYFLRLHAIPLIWKTQIIEWDPPYHFVDLQLKGPYKYWRHSHRFETKRNGTVMQDSVDYIVPGGFLSPLFHSLFVKKDLDRIFDYREKKLTEIFAKTE
jgi:ligand-binding SRPBCC domain-containing protein